jgi:hypothetical protein
MWLCFPVATGTGHICSEHHYFGIILTVAHLSAGLAGLPFVDIKGFGKKRSRHTAALKKFDRNVYTELKKRNLPTRVPSCELLCGECERHVLVHHLVVRACEYERLERTGPWL